MKIAMLISGGVDSSVALKMLKEQGHDVTAFYLKIWLEDEVAFLGECPWEQDLVHVRAVCEKEQVPLQVIPLQKEYWEHVVQHTLELVRGGYTPNPDILCNQRIKFGLFLNHIDNSYDKIATGHYAQVVEHEGLFVLKRSPDAVKDQTYFLSYLDQKQLSRTMFPLGELTKAQVRVRALEYGLPNAHRKDSQGICFLGKLKFADFINHYLGTQEGDMREYETGAIVGKHRGYWYYTIGQRQGLGLAGGPWYVVAKDHTTNSIFISRSYYAADKKRDSFCVKALRWALEPEGEIKALVKLRHGPDLHACTLTKKENGEIFVQLETRDQGIAPGQYATFYQDELCIGAGVIASELIDPNR